MGKWEVGDLLCLLLLMPCNSPEKLDPQSCRSRHPLIVNVKLHPTQLCGLLTVLPWQGLLHHLHFPLP